MKHNIFSNKLFLGGLIGCLVLILVAYFFLQPKSENSVTNENPQEASTIQLPEGDFSSQFTETDPWSEWILKQADISAKNFVKASAGEITYDDAYKEIVSKLTAQLDQLKKHFGIPPPLDYAMPTPLEFTPTSNKKYTGPQTVEALMAEFHGSYGKRTRRFDDRYPPEQWLQMLLNKGVHIENRAEYSAYMTIRGELIASENDVDTRELVASSFGIANDNWEVFKSAYIDSAIAEAQRLLQTMNADPNIRGGITIGDDKNFLPFYHNRKITYVTRRATGATFRGTSLTQEQKFNLVFRGVDPEGIDIVYVDSEGNRLEEKPEPMTREEVRKMMAEGEKPPPAEWWDKEATIPDSEDLERFLPSENTDTELDSRKQRAREEFERQAAEAARQPGFEQFIQEVRQLEKFATMSDTDIAAELEKQLRQQLLPGLPTEQSLEDALREKITPKPLTPERFNKAKQILQNYGPKEGLRRLAKEDPELAEYFRRNPQKVPPERSQPSNANDTRKE